MVIIKELVDVKFANLSNLFKYLIIIYISIIECKSNYVKISHKINDAHVTWAIMTNLLTTLSFNQVH